MTILLLILLGVLSAWEEVEELVHRKAWRQEDYHYPEWEEKANTLLAKLPGNWDSHHVTFGLFVVVMMIAFHTCKNSITIEAIPLLAGAYKDMASIIIYWLGFFYVRNIGMHIIFKKKPLWGYLWKI